MSDLLSELAYLQWLKTTCGYQHVRPLRGGRWAAVYPFWFTAAIMTGRIGDMTGYDDRWCFHDEAAALSSLDAWNGDGEPQGWHRHPGTGRRRPDGNSEREFVNP